MSMHSLYLEKRGATSILCIKGRVDAASSAQIHEKIMDEIEKGNRQLVIDFSDVSYISSAGLRVLIYASKAMSKAEGSLSLCSLDANIMKIFEISGLARMFKIGADLESVMQDFPAPEAANNVQAGA